MKPPVASVLSQALHGFFTDYLPRQRAMSPHTLHSYRDRPCHIRKPAEINR